MLGRVTNIDVRTGKHKKSIWYEDTELWPNDIYPNPDGSPRPSRYGPSREYLANCLSIEIADQLVSLWNERIEH